MGGGKLRAAAGLGGGTGSAQCRCARYTRFVGGARGEEGNVHRPHCHHGGCRLLALGLVESLSRPGGNITGLSFFNAELAAKRLELLKEAIPALTKAAILLNPNNASNPLILRKSNRPRRH